MLQYKVEKLKPRLTNKIAPTFLKYLMAVLATCWCQRNMLLPIDTTIDNKKQTLTFGTVIKIIRSPQNSGLSKLHYRNVIKNTI